MYILISNTFSSSRVFTNLFFANNQQGKCQDLNIKLDISVAVSIVICLPVFHGVSKAKVLLIFCCKTIPS